VEYLKSLGVTEIELMPIHEFVVDKHLLDKGFTNYWGYNTIGFFAPECGYSSTGRGGQQVGEFKTMVKTFHQAGIEVILDVVYNHTAEGNQLGPTLTFRGRLAAPRSPGVHARADHVAPRPPGPAAPAFLPGPAHPRLGGQGPVVA
jgi:pullulanase/glycogen debranching enzyme